jgi:hypothetical protein
MDREAFNAEAAALNVESDADADRRTFEAASRDFYIPGWTHADIDTRVWDHKILDDMKVEAEYNPDMARALRALYGEDVYSYADYIRDTKGEMVNDCDCNSCAEEGKWFNQ